MITRTVYLASIDTGSLLLGYQGENDHIQYAIRCDAVFDDYPTATVTMRVKSPNGTVYPKTVTTDGNTVLWTVDSSDTAVPGGGQVQITFTDNGEVVKTVVANTTVLASLMGNDPAPDPIQDWIDNANEILSGMQEAAMHIESVTGTDPEIEAENNYAYICGEVSTISITPPDEGVCDVIFVSGSTPAVLTLPDSVKMPEWFSGVEANRTYEISFFNGLGTVMSWV